MRVGVYNPLARQRDYRVRLPVQGGSYRVQGEQGQEVAVELVPLPTEVFCAALHLTSADLPCR